MIEAQSLGNAILKKQEAHQAIATPSTSTVQVNPNNSSINQTEETALYTDMPDIVTVSPQDQEESKSPFDIAKRVEVSALAEIFLGMLDDFIGFYYIIFLHVYCIFFLSFLFFLFFSFFSFLSFSSFLLLFPPFLFSTLD
jgi:hypothetical protein